MKINKRKHLITQLLKRVPEYRDDDRKLLCAVWQSELLKQGIDPIHFARLFAMIQRGKLTNPESIRRTRQKLQELDPELRGEKYRERMERQKDVKKELGYSPGEQINIFK